MELKIDPDVAREAVKLAVLEQLGEEGRSNLIASALDYLLRDPPKDRYSTHQPESPLQSAFNQAAAQVAREIVAEQVAGDAQFRALIAQKVGEAMAKVDEMNFSTYVAHALAEALTK